MNSSSSRTALTARVGLVAAVASVVLILWAPWHWLALLGALLFACVPAGAAVMCWIDAGESEAQAALTLITSVTVFALASAIMIWTSAWHPRLLCALLIPIAVSCTARLWCPGPI